MKISLYASNDNLIVITGVTDSTGTPITGATLTGTITPISGTGTTTVTFGDVSGQPGNYQGPLVAASVPTPGSYTMVVSGTASGLTLSVRVGVNILPRII